MFRWSQRKRVGGFFPSITVTFGGAWAGADEAFLTIGGTAIGKSVFPADTPETIAAHFSAEFGNTGGSVVNMIARSGANRLHGSAYEFHRNSGLNANNLFSNSSGLSLPEFQRNVFGGAAGGPVLLPRLYDGRNRTFFFFKYEGERQENAATRTATLPTLRERAGDFSDTRDAAGRLTTIFNPFDTRNN